MSMLRHKGNALFLILIAVALFAALSYAITQSGRGGGTVDREKASMTGSQITQFAAEVRAAVQRMILNGASPIGINYHPHSDCQGFSNCVWSSEGGGVAYQCPTPDQVVGSSDGNQATLGDMGWRFRGINKSNDAGFYIKDVGTNTDVVGRDAIAYLPGVPLVVCQQINKQLGITNWENPALSNDATGVASGNSAPTYGVLNVLDAYPGQSFACDKQDALSYGYYHALIEQ